MDHHGTACLYFLCASVVNFTPPRSLSLGAQISSFLSNLCLLEVRNFIDLGREHT